MSMIMFWATVLAISVLLYVLLDGFDLGVGILFGMTRAQERRGTMLSAVSPVWDGNETWLIVTGVVLWGAFPSVYATQLSAFYVPFLLMLAGLILRGVAFEYRHRAEGSRWVWDIALAGGSFVAAFVPGLTVGALVEGLPIANGQYAGGDFGWLSRFAVLCGVGLCLGYALLGACWLVKKTEARPRRGLPADPASDDRAHGLPVRGLYLCAGGASLGHGSLAAAAVSAGVPGRRRDRDGSPRARRRLAA
jgi:cytochrome d ubiquinol oxidase subunit II